MRHLCLASTALVLALAFASTDGVAQQPKPAPQPPAAQAEPQPAAPGPYKAVPVTLPKPLGDASFDAFRKELTDIAKKKDRAALAGKVVAKGFFWEREDTNAADAKKSGIDNLAAAVGLDAKGGSGWEVLGTYLADATAEPVPEMKGVVCSPATPQYNEKDFEQVIQATQTDPTEWAYPSAANLELRGKPDAKAPVVEKLAITLLRLYPDDKQPDSAADWMRLIAPSGKIGYVQFTGLMPLVSDQLCYLKDASSWRIAGYRGGATDQ
jgi:hypothetical protein